MLLSVNDKEEWQEKNYDTCECYKHQNIEWFPL